MKRGNSKKLVTLLSMVLMGVGYSACTSSNAKAPQNGSVGDKGTTTPQYHFAVFNADGSGNPVQPGIFDDSTPGATLALVDGKSYVFQLTSLNGSGYSYETTMQRVDLVNGGSPTTLTLKEGNNLVTAPTPGDYSIAVAPTDGGTIYPGRTFSGNVVCDNPAPFTASGWDLSKIAVSGGGSDNVYSYSASGVVSGGQAPYVYAWDFSGDGSPDSLFSSSTSAQGYDSFVGDRSSIGLIVKDACNTTVSVTVARNVAPGGLPSRTPGDKSEFVHGTVTAASGTAATYKDIWDNNAGIDYWATNNSISKPVHSTFKANGASSAFTIASDKFTYGLPSSTTFGLNISMGNINASLGDTVANTIVDATNAVMSAITFSTEQVGDGKPQLVVTDTTSCTLQTKGIEVIQVVGVPCSPGTTNPKWGDREMRWTFHGWGSYTCTNLTGPGSSVVAMTGGFDGVDDLIDACVGGGQGGQGGDFPPQF